MNDKELRWSRRLSVVPRWAVVPTIRRQSVAEHSFHVACTAMWLLQFHASREGYNKAVFDANVMQYALKHDIKEAAEGDTPTPAKKQPPINYVDWSQMRLVVKVADILEALAFLHEERGMGNTFVQDIFDERKAALALAWGHFQQRSGPVKNPEDLWGLYKLAMYKSHPAMESDDD